MSDDDQDSHDDDDREDDFSLLLDSIDDEDSESEIEETVAMEEPLLPKFLFKIKEENKLTQKCLQKIASTTKQLFQGSVRRLKRKAEDCLAKAGLDSREIPGFEKSFQDEIDDYNDIMASDMKNFHKRDDCSIPFVVSINNLYL